MKQKRIFKKCITKAQKLFNYAFTITTVTFLLFGCEKDDPAKCTSAILKDYSNTMSGCGWLIQLPDSSYLEPFNLHELDFELKDNKPVCVEYEVTGGGTLCQVGHAVKINSIR